MGTTTANMGLYKPDYNEAGSSWYDDINANFDKLDAARVMLGKQHTAVSHTGDTNEYTLYSLVIPGGTIKANGVLVITALFSMTGSTNTKTLKVKLGGTVFSTTTITASASTISQSSSLAIHNRNSQSSQVAYSGSTSAAVITGVVDTSVNQTLAITGQLALGTETITLESVVVEVMR